MNAQQINSAIEALDDSNEELFVEILKNLGLTTYSEFLETDGWNPNNLPEEINDALLRTRDQGNTFTTEDGNFECWSL